MLTMWQIILNFNGVGFTYIKKKCVSYNNLYLKEGETSDTLAWHFYTLTLIHVYKYCTQ